MMKVLVAITGASGAIFGIDLLIRLKEAGVTAHLILSKWGAETIRYETNWDIEDVKALAAECFDEHDMYAAPASGSSDYEAMVICPCSMKTLAAISCDFSNTLIVRAASVMLKERKPLVLVARETPLSTIQLQNMSNLSLAGATIMPPVPAFYTRPESLEEMIENFSLRILDHLGIKSSGFKRWGLEEADIETC